MQTKDAEISNLKRTLISLEEERRELTRVSSIVNLEKQNQILKKEIHVLNEKINRLQAKPAPVTAPVAVPVAAPVTVPVTAPVTVPAPAPAPVTAPATATATAPATAPVTAPAPAPVTAPATAPVTAPAPSDLFEKTIGGITYYVSMDDMTVYDRNADDSVGAAIGKLERYKIVSLQP